MGQAIRVERWKKDRDLVTYRETVAFLEGKRQDEVQKQREIGKRPCQQFLLTLASGPAVVLLGLGAALVKRLF